jgi:hypothetical protein
MRSSMPITDKWDAMIKPLFAQTENHLETPSSQRTVGLNVLTSEFLQKLKK